MRTKSIWHSNLLPLSEIQVLLSFFQKAISKLQANNLIWILTFSSLVVTLSCNKDESVLISHELSQQEINFFEPGYIESTNANVKNLQLISQRSLSVVDSVYNEIKRQNKDYHFVSYLIEEYGYPIWSYADYIPVDSDSNINIVVIPMAFHNGTELSGLLLAAYNGISFDFEIFSRHHLEGLISQVCDLASDQEILGILAIQSMEERVFGFSDLITYNQFISCPRFEGQFDQPTIMPRDGEIEEVCYYYCTRWTTNGVVTTNLWASLCNTSNNFWYACPNPNPMDETNEHTIRICTYWVEVCIQYVVGVDPIPDDSGWWSVPNSGSGGGPPNPPSVELGPHLHRLEACGGLGELYDYGPSNPSGEHPDRIFCEQLQALYDCLPFLTSDEELVAWYLWYDATYAGDTWGDILDFGCSNSMSPILREEGLKLFRKLHSPGEAYPPFSGWTDFESIWNKVAQIVQNGVNIDADEREWLALNEASVDEVLIFFTSDGVNDHTRASAQIYTKLAKNNLLNLSLTQLQYNAYLLQPIISGSLNQHNLQAQMAISALSWYSIFHTEFQNNGSNWQNEVGELLEDIRLATDEGYETIDAAANLLHQLTINSDISLPENLDKWKLLWVLLKPILQSAGINIGNEFMDYSTEVDGFKKAFELFQQGDRQGAFKQYFAGIGELTIISELINSETQLSNSSAEAFQAKNLLDLIEETHPNIDNSILDLVQDEYSVEWDSNLDIINIKNPQEQIVGTITDDAISEDLEPEVEIIDESIRDLLDIDNLENLNQVDISSNFTQSLASSAKRDPGNHIRYQVKEPSLQAQINDILENGDITGAKTESLVQEYIEQDGWVHQTGGSYGSNNGFDNVFYNPDTQEVLIDESKQWPPVLSGQNTGTGLPKQMSDLWIDHVIIKIEPSDPILANRIREAKLTGKLIKTVSAIKQTNPGYGSIVTIKVGG